MYLNSPPEKQKLAHTRESKGSQGQVPSRYLRRCLCCRHRHNCRSSCHRQRSPWLGKNFWTTIHFFCLKATQYPWELLQSDCKSRYWRRCFFSRLCWMCPTELSRARQICWHSFSINFQLIVESTSPLLLRAIDTEMFALLHYQLRQNCRQLVHLCPQ